MISTIRDASFLNDFCIDGYLPADIMAGHPELHHQWDTFFSSLEQLGNEEIINRSHDMTRFLRENGITYNIYGDPSGMNRPWHLDIIPSMISATEWSPIAAGLAQRASLFDFILKDIYGEQQLIRKGIIPMEIIYSHPGFLRECHHIGYPGNHQLIIYSADIARSRDGSYWILNDRTQSPSGSGYALENRMAMARIVPELFSNLKVRRLSPFYNAFHRSLTRLAPPASHQPRIVILTPGPSNETYFEHSFLSSHMGFTLVQGDDLMVRDNFVWLKTLGGLEKVDVIVRRVDDIYCDPLELKEDSQLGIPGLLQSVRAGHVTIANPLGSSVIENPGLIPFLPAIAKYFLNETLILPTIASWWCGQEKERQYTLDHLPELVIKRIYRESLTRTSVDAGLLDQKSLAELKARIIAQPHAYVAQEKVDFAITPTLINGKLQPGHALFRSFAVSDNDGYTVMDGGLTRTSIDQNNIVISNQLGGFSKDTWILSADDVNTVESRKEQVQTETQLAAIQYNVLPSRTAENLFWVGRYAERVLGNARFQRTVMQLVEESGKSFIDDAQGLKFCLLTALTIYTHTYPGFLKPDDESLFLDPWKELGEILFDTNRTGSLTYNINSFTRAIHSVRDYWSADTWRVLREMEDNWNQAATAQYKSHYKILNALDGVITSMMAFISLNRESISREQGWKLLDTGRKTEQSLLLISMLRSTLVFPQEDTTSSILLEAVLTSNESLVNYRFKYRAHLRLSLVIELMLLDSNNPRSLIYQVERLKAYLAALPEMGVMGDKGILTEHNTLAQKTMQLLLEADREKLARPDLQLNRFEDLDLFLKQLNGLICAISDTVSKTYFKHAQAQKQLFR